MHAAASNDGSTIASHIARERDLYLALLQLGERDHDVSELLHGVLAIVRELTSATRLYVQAGSELEGCPPFWAAIGASSEALDAARSHVSRSIIREALRGDDVIETACAARDARFDGAASVRDNEVGAVICAALGGDPGRGVLYVQGARGSGGLSPDAARIVGITARAIANTVAREVRRATLARAHDATTLARSRFACDEIVGRSRALATALDLAALAAGSDSPVLLTGASGSGKSLFARAIARGGRRSSGPFVELNCAALPSELVESELFGAARGAHSTASESRTGLVGAATGGTLFLDEIAELPPQAQAKLLHLTQTGTYHRLGENTPRHADVRIIAATNADVGPDATDRRLRRDLYYRLAVVRIALPSLDARPEDVSLLVRALVPAIARDLGVPALEPTEAAIAALEARTWPGNVRELRNAIELGVLRARAEASSALDPRHLSPTSSENEHETDGTLAGRTRAYQRAVIEEALRSAGGRANVAAERLGLSRSHLYHLITTLGVPRP